MTLPELRSSLAARTTVEVRTDLLDQCGGVAYRVLSEQDGFSLLELTWTMHARLLTRLAELPAAQAPAPKKRRS